MKDQVAIVVRELGLDEALPMAAAVRAANETLGFSSQGPLPAQVERILAAISS
jgi:hypothetical protein